MSTSFTAAIVGAIIAPIGYLKDSVPKEDLFELAQEDYLNNYKDFIREHSRVDAARHIIDVMKAQRALEESDETLNNTRAVWSEGKRLMQVEVGKRLGEKEYMFSVMRKEFSQDYHDAITDYITSHLETFRFLMDKVETADLHADAISRIEANLESYVFIISHLNNIDLNQLGENNPDTETFLVHREFGVREATKLLAEIRGLAERKFVAEIERTNISLQWEPLEFPVRNILGSVHRKVKRISADL